MLEETSLRKGYNRSYKALGTIKKDNQLNLIYIRMTNTHAFKLFILAGVQKHPYFFRSGLSYGLDYLNKFKWFCIILLFPILYRGLCSA